MTMQKVLILGGDGYLGWPTAMSLGVDGYEVHIADNFLRRNLMAQNGVGCLLPVGSVKERLAAFEACHGKKIYFHEGDCCDHVWLDKLLEAIKPHAIVHYAEQPSAPYSMMGFDEAELTLRNNVMSTFNLVWAVVKHCPDCHIVKLGTMGEYGTPNIDIEEGWIDITHKGRTDKFLFPRQASSLYHTTKVLDTDLLWFYVRNNRIRVTDLMQGPVYGFKTNEITASPDLNTLVSYDHIFGTVLNRFIAQAVTNTPLTVYGKGGQTRGYLDIKDTLQCVALSIKNPPNAGELRVLNQFTELFSVNQLAQMVSDAAKKIGFKGELVSIPNPRRENEEHYYNAKSTGLAELGLKPDLLTTTKIESMLRVAAEWSTNIDTSVLLPSVKW